MSNPADFCFIFLIKLIFMILKWVPIQVVVDVSEGT